MSTSFPGFLPRFVGLCKNKPVSLSYLLWVILISQGFRLTQWMRHPAFQMGGWVQKRWERKCGYGCLCMDISIKIFLYMLITFHMGTTLTWKNVPIIHDGCRVLCGLLPISPCSSPIYFPSANYCYQFLVVYRMSTVAFQNVVYRNINQLSEFLYINPRCTAHNDVYIDNEEADLEMSKETTRICHIPMMVLVAPSAQKNFIPSTLQWTQRDCASGQRKKVSVSFHWTPTICQIPSQVLVSTSGETRGSSGARPYAQQHRGVGCVNQ